MSRFRVGVDIGGTFTDFVLVDEKEGRIHLGKRLTTHGNYLDAVMNGFDELVAAVGGGDPRTAPERVRALAERVKRLESELGKIGRAERKGRSEEVAAHVRTVGGVPLVVASEDIEADALRELTQDVASRLGAEAAVVLGSTHGGRALLVAACTKALVARGVTASEVADRGGRPAFAFSDPEGRWFAVTP